MSEISPVGDIGAVSLETAQQMNAFRDLAAEAQYQSGATNHERFLALQGYPAEALYASGATNHEQLFGLLGYPAEALHASGATKHDVSGFAPGSPYLLPESVGSIINSYI